MFDLTSTGLALFAAWGVARVTWTILWIVLAAITIALAWLFRTRWNHVKPWRKCAVLSLWVHVLLACLATTVRIVSGSPGVGDEQPIKVAVLPPEAIVCEHASPEAPTNFEQPDDPPVVEPPAVPLPDPETDAAAEAAPRADEPSIDNVLADPPAELVESEPAPPLEAPGLLEAPKPVEPDPSPSIETPAREPVTEVPPSPDAPQSTSLSPQPSTPNPRPAPTPPRWQPPAELAARFAEDRAELAVRGGGNAQTEKAVRSALAWLAGAQASDGRWDASQHGAGHERAVLGHDRNGAGRNADAGVTGLALLAFLGAGQTHHDGAYPKQVAQGLNYLRRIQASNGALHGDAQFFARMYCHSMAAFAAAEALALTRDERLMPVVRRAIDYTIAAQHPSDGGWRYRPGNTGDTSQLGWQLMVLQSAELAGIDIPEPIWSRVERFLRRVRRGSHGGLAAYRPESAPSRSMTAEASYCRQLLAHRYGGTVNAPASREAADSLLRTSPSPQHVNLYYWYYATLALHHAQNDSQHAKSAWQSWNDALTRSLLATQNEDGSWPATSVWGGYGGRVYTTAMAALCLEVYYRYQPQAVPAKRPPGLAGPRFDLATPSSRIK